MQQRGKLTPRIKESSKELLGYEISQKELRLMVYVFDRLLNTQKLNPAHIDQEEQGILKDWLDKGYIIDGVSKELGRPLVSEWVTLKITKEFYNALAEILWLGYVNLTN